MGMDQSRRDSLQTGSGAQMFRTAIHPDRHKQFREQAAPKVLIKEGRKEAILACTNCGIPGDEDGVELKRCTECQISYYCSRECQKEHWPIHKTQCDPSLDGGIQPLIKSVTGNPMLAHYLKICIAFEFNLHLPDDKWKPESRKTIVRSPLYVHIDVGIEPTKITEFMNLYTFKDEWPGAKKDIDGMLQFHHIYSAKSGIKPEAIMSHTNAQIWGHSREAADEDGLKDNMVVLVRFANDMKQCVTCTMVIDDDALESAREAAPFTQTSALTGKTTEHAMDIASCIEFLNTHIRSDKDDRLRLRRSMRECDKELIKDAGRKDVARHSVDTLRIKINREHVYKSHAVELVIPPGGTEADTRYNVLRTVTREEGDRINEGVIDRMREMGLQREEPEQPARPPANRTQRRQMERDAKKAAKKGR